MVLLSFLFMLATYVLYRKHYKLDEPEYDRICREIETRKAEEEAEARRKEAQTAKANA